MRHKMLAVLVLLVIGLGACAAKNWGEMNSGKPGFVYYGISEDPTYGYTEENPVKLGDYKNRGVAPEYDYMMSLRGPHGESLVYHRLGSCCIFESEGSPTGRVILDQWEIRYQGQAKPVVIYLDAYRFDRPLAPLGFTYVSAGQQAAPLPAPHPVQSPRLRAVGQN